jgi:transcriptional regulator with XRE-family HTH domain
LLAFAARKARAWGEFIMDPKNRLGIRLREARLSRGLSLSGLQMRSGVSKARLSRYENGHVVPSIRTLARLASALNISLASLLDEREAAFQAFAEVIQARGVTIRSRAEAARIADVLADMIMALGGSSASDEVSDPPSAGRSTDGLTRR